MPLLALSAVDVRLEIAPVDSTRVSRDDLAKVVVMARDSSGRTWVARAVSPSLARFDALPPGQYMVSADFSQSQEPLRIAGTAPAFVVSERAVPTLSLAVQPRPLRFPVARKSAIDSVRGIGGSAAPAASQVPTNRREPR